MRFLSPACLLWASLSLAQDPPATPVVGASEGPARPDSAYVTADKFDTASERREPPKTRALTLHPGFSLLISGLNLSFEAPLGRGLWSFEIPFYLGYNERVYDNPYFFAGSGFTLRRYLLERGAGSYFAPSLDVLNVHRFEKGPGQGNNLLVVAPNLRMGYRWTWKTFALDASWGFLYYETLLTEGERSGDDWGIRRGLFPMTQFALGIPF